MKGERTRRCRYCGQPATEGLSCSRCRELEGEDPARLAELGAITEREHGLEPPWPESEADDRSGEA